MALALDIMRGGVSAGTAKAINGSINNAVTAAGTVIGDATNLQASTVRISSCASGAGVEVPDMLLGDSCVVHNAGANQCLVYPDTSSVAINQISAGSAVILPINTAMLFHKMTSTQIVAFMSA